ncbi:chemotaxis protein CheA [Telmatobacter bradus]|uniref:chemotaxis protein CheA n=1 Tax=Telmatobacter bradus TaxID=474953 RepID=UPI003B432B14
MKIDLSQFRDTFLQESAEHVAILESGLLILRDRPDDQETLHAIFRSAHSIKGGSGSFGYHHLMQFTHVMENLLEQLRSAAIPVTDEAIELLLQSVDVLRILLHAGPEEALPEGAQDLLQSLQTLAEQECTPAADAAESDDRPSDSDADCSDTDLKMYRIEFRPDREMFSSGTNPIVLLRNLAQLGSACVTHLHHENLPEFSAFDPLQCYLSWTIEMVSCKQEEELREVFEFVEHLAEIKIERIDTEEELRPQNASTTESVAGAPPEVHPAKSLATAEKHGTAKRTAGAPSANGESSSIRVATEKIDRLIDLVGELVIAHVMTAQMVENFTPECLPKLRESVVAAERNTRELHERVMAVRMLPMGTLFHRYQRTVYDIAHANGKQIRLNLTGEETEIDKSMLELLGDPLTHLVRNAADHGIEMPQERVAAGKPAEGTIDLRAFHRSGRVVIEVCDDGKGLDLERIRNKAIDRGLITEQTKLSDEQLRMLIFEPGFSTRDTISDLSGRGVGMDVVKQNVQQLNGTVNISSKLGVGSVVTIELPLTLAILEGLLVRVADRKLVLPLLSVVETVSPRPGQMQRVAEQGEVIVIRKTPIPILRLSRYLGSQNLTSKAANGNSEDAQRTLVVVIEAGRKKVGLVVDELLGQQQVVVKSLEKNLRKVDGLMGATILADGCVAPILDVASIAELNLYSLHAANHASLHGAPPASLADAPSIINKEGEESVHALV